MERKNSPQKLFRFDKLRFCPAKSLQRLLLIRLTESVIIRGMPHFTPIVRFLAAAGILVCQYFSAVAQPPLIFPQPRRKAFQMPAIEPQRIGASADLNKQNSVQDVWFLIEYDGETVGYESLSTVEASDSELRASSQGKAFPVFRRSRETSLKLKRLGNDLSVSAHLETIESADGVLHSWSLRRTAADGTVVHRSAVWNTDDREYLINGGTSDQSKQESLQSRVQPRSPILSAWLAGPNLERPQQWASAVLFPETSAVVDIEIRRLPPQSLQVKDKSTITVTRYDYWPSNQPEFRSSVYYDDVQEIVLVEQPLLGRTLRFYRTDAATALGEENLQSLDLQLLTGIPLRRPLLNPETSSVVRMKISVGESEQISLPSSDFQTVEQTVANSLIVTLKRPTIDAADSAPNGPLRNKTRPDRRFTDSSHWLDSNSDNVRRMAVTGGGAVSDPHEKCRRLTGYINSHLRLSAFSTSLRPASEVAKSRQGDCTEYSVLLAAVMRSEGVPARVVVGFAYVPNPASFAPHMWTEAWIDGQWIPFDATLGTEVNPLTRLKVNDSDLADSSTNGTLLFVPLLRFLGRATVEILPE